MLCLDFSIDNLDSAEKKLLALNQEWSNVYVDFLVQYQQKSNIAVISSGSTGTPKTLHFTSDQYNASAKKSIAYFDFKAGQKAFSALSGNTVGGQLMVIRALLAGLKLTLAPPSLDAYTNVTETYDFAPMVASQFQELVNNGSTSYFKNILLGGGPIPAHLQEQLPSLSTTVFASYGMTETLSHVALRNLSLSEKQYTLLPGNKAGIGEQGNIILDCDYLTDLIETNDLGEVKNGKLTVHGRLDFVIISSGKKINPEDVESVLSKFITQPFIVFPIPDEKFGNVLGLFVEQTLSQEEQSELNKYNNTALTHLKIRGTKVGTIYQTEQKILRTKCLNALT